MPHQLAGILIDPPWSPPMAMSTSPAATSAALPLEDPPAVRAWSWGLRTGAGVRGMAAAGEAQALAYRLALDGSRRHPESRVTMVASTSGT